MPDQPAALPTAKTYTYKRTGETDISIDVYLPVASDVICPVVLFIHGGAWIGGRRSDFSPPLFEHFLSLNFIVTSLDYRLLPETSFSGQIDDFRDVELWLRHTLPSLFTNQNVMVDGDRIIVAGASAGALLAFLTPSIWKYPPNAILSLYGPTDMHSILPVQTARFSQWPVQEMTPELLNAATNFARPPTETALPKNAEDYMKPRLVLAREILSKGLVADFLIKGLLRSERGELKLPEKGSASKKEIDAISPLQLLQGKKYPPVCQVIAGDDDIFDKTHGNSFHEALEHLGIHCKKIVAIGKGHGFDICETSGSEADETIIRPAVTWVAAWCLRT